MMPDPNTLLSIGNLARATGLSVDTIRVWERRYGQPKPIRLPSGHRRYPQETVTWLRRVSEALTLGHRPSEVVHLEDAELSKLLDGREGRDSMDFTTVLGFIKEMDSERLRSWLERELQRLGVERFLDTSIGPLDRSGRCGVVGRESERAA